MTPRCIYGYLGVHSYTYIDTYIGHFGEEIANCAQTSMRPRKHDSLVRYNLDEVDFNACKGGTTGTTAVIALTSHLLR